MNEQNTQMAVIQPQQKKMDALTMYFEQTSFETSMRVCEMLAHSDLVPENYQYKPCGPEVDSQGNPIPANIAVNKAAKRKATANCLIALNKAAQLGVDPLTVMQNMAIVYGRPSWSSTFLIGSVNTCGRFKPLKFKFGDDGRLKEKYTEYTKPGSSSGGGGEKTIDMPNLTCYAYTTERGDDEVLKGTTISLKMAFDEKWLTKSGSKWLTMPEQMLMYRAAAFWARVYAPEVSLGMLTREEAEDVFTEYQEVVDTTTGEVKVMEAIAAAASAEIPTDNTEAAAQGNAPEPAPAPAPAPAPETRTRKPAAQQRMPNF